MSVLGSGTIGPASAEASTTLEDQGAFFSLFSLPNPASPSTGNPLIPLVPPLAISFNVTEELHRFEVEESPPTASCGLRIRQDYEPTGVAKVHMRMTPMPNNYQPGAGRVPWPTVLLPFLSQRFTPLDGHFNFFDDEESGFSALGAGRVYPTGSGLLPRLAAVLDAQSPTGALQGLTGTGIVSGEVQPPSGFAFNVLFRLQDPSGNLRASVPPAPLVDGSDPTPEKQGATGTSFLPLLSRADPDRPMEVESSADGRFAQVTLHEVLHLVNTSFGVHAPGLRSLTRTGPVIGRHSTKLTFDLTTADHGVLAGYSRGDTFAFFDDAGKSIGGFQADTLEARAFPSADGGPVRLGGFAQPIPTSGFGQFEHPVGMVSINGAWSPTTGAISTFYMVRLSMADAILKVVA